MSILDSVSQTAADIVIFCQPRLTGLVFTSQTAVDSVTRALSGATAGERPDWLIY